jgi:hypothetical protein
MKATTEDALKAIVEYLRTPKSQRGHSYSEYGYDVYLPNVLRASAGGTREDSPEWERLSSVFLDAGWHLVRRGILRPGVNQFRGQATDDGSAGSGFSITPFGKQWLEADSEVTVPVEPERAGQILAKHADRFGEGFLQRSQEAIRCYGAHAYLACCAMCGAAAESIILACAEAKAGPEEVEKVYKGAAGRSKVTNLLVGQADKRLRDGIEHLGDLLKYWRDNSAHGQAFEVDDNEAFMAIVILMRYSAFVSEHWDALTT